MAEYLHPSLSTRIIDNSEVVISAQGLTTLYAASKAAKGPDNIPTNVTSESEFLFFFGAPNMRKYGQTAYNVIRWLRNGGGVVFTRVLPYLEKDSDDSPLQQSTYAAYILEVGTKTSGGKQLKLRVRTLGDGANSHVSALSEASIRDDATLKSISLAAPSAAETDGFTYYPLTALRYASRGEAGNYLGGRIELNTSLDETFEHRLYDLELYSTSTSQRLEGFTFSFLPEAADASGRSQYLPNVLKTYSSYARAVMNEDNYDAVVNFINSDPEVASKVDVLFATERDVADAETIHTGTTIASGSADLSPSPEIFRPFGGGTDGDWVGVNSVDSLLYKAYSGSGDVINPSTGANVYDTHFGDIWDKISFPIDVILDANYPTAVKIAISNFAASRGDIFCAIDSGFTGSPTQALNYRRNNIPLNTYHSAIWAQDFIVDDTEFTGAQISVTPTFFLAEKIPQVDNANGIHYAFVGPRRGVIAGYDSVSWLPNDAYQEELYKAGVNYAVRNSNGIGLKFNSQKTSQLKNSALSDIPHVRTLLRIRREVEAAAESAQFEFNDTDTMGALEYSLNGLVRKWVANRALESVAVTVYASKYDKQQRILRVRIEMTFTGFVERVFTDIVINR